MKLKGRKVVGSELRRLAFQDPFTVAKYVTKIEHQLEEAREALPSPSLLEAVANWIDLAHPNDPDPEVQKDMRAWAAKIRAYLDKYPGAM